MSDQEADVGAYVGFLRSLNEQCETQFLIGGQAVNFWAEIVSRRNGKGGLLNFQPFTSKDCDIWVDSQSWQFVRECFSDRLQEGTSPADGQLGILTLSASPPRMVDFLPAIFGIRQHDLDRIARRAPNFHGIRVMDPIYLFLSKCHCFIGLDQAGRQDERHTRMLTIILPDYLGELIRDSEANQIPARNVVKDIKLLLKLCQTQKPREALKRLEITPDSLIPWKRLAESPLELFRKFSGQS